MKNFKETAFFQCIRCVAMFVLGLLAALLCILPAAVCFNLQGGYGVF